MRIAYDFRAATDARPAGVGRVVRCAAEALGRLGPPHALELLTDRPTESPPGWTVRVGPATPAAWHAWAAGRLARGAADVYVSLSSLLVPAMHPRRSVAFIHDLTPIRRPTAHTWRTRAAYSIAVRRVVRKAAAVLVNSEATRADLVRTLGVGRDRVTVAPLGVAPCFAEPPADDVRRLTLERLRLEPGFLLSVATVEPRKNLDGFLDAYARLRSRRPATPRLVLAGGAGWGDVRLADALRSRGLADSVSVLGWVDDDVLAALYASARAFVTLTFDEGFCLPVVEAMSLGVPVVASRVGAIPEVAGDAAVLVDPTDPAEAAARLADVLDDDALAARMAAAGRVRARAFTWRAFAETLLAAAERAAG